MRSAPLFRSLSLAIAVAIAALAGVVVATAAPLPAAAVETADVDGDTIADAVERAVCGSATCATGVEDRDGDGIPDATEVPACGDTTCASPTADRDDDGIPDYAERLVCGSDRCSNAKEDADGDRIDRINIDGYMPVPFNARGVVGVDTTRTSVKFTVLDRGYFDAPGSTITFSTERRADGIYLVQDAVGHGTNGVTMLGIFALRGSDTAWSLQSAALAQLLEKGVR